MASCLSGGGRAYRLETLDLEMIMKSPSTSSWISNSSNSPSSTLSESSNSPLTMSTRKPRTPRKRPNQIYNEAAALLSTAYPKIFPTKHLLTKHPCKFTKSQNNKYKNSFPFESSDDLLMPFQVIDHSPQRPNFPIEHKGLNSRQSTREINSNEVYREDFDAESILDEEVGDQGIDSIMGNLSTQNESVDDSNACNMELHNACCYGYPIGLGFEFGYGMKREFRAMRHVDGDWWRFPSVNMLDITPTPSIDKIPAEKKKKKKKKKVENNISEPAGENSMAGSKLAPLKHSPNAGLLLKLNHDTILNAWSEKGSPFSGDASGSESTGNDVQARLAQIDLFSENGGMREASVLRYKEKRRTRLFSKKIRYQVRKVNADRRPRMKGRFVRTPNSPED